ncbi:MAG: DNA-methyltransferase, partial [Terriglobia bacterium]
MSHQSDSADRLRIRTLKLSGLNEMPEPSAHVPEVWFFILPCDRRVADAERIARWCECLQQFVAGLHEQSVVGILTTPEDAALTWPKLASLLHFQLWVAVKLADPPSGSSTRLPEHHAALLILTKSHASLRHTKTRIGYSYCPACDKTTKDYGGKKHTYHEYGTLMSDVWRDIAYTPGQSTDPIVARLADLFGLEPYRQITVVHLEEVLRQPPHLTRPQILYTSHDPAQTPSRLINGDCLEELRRLPDNSIEFCFADPPYNLSKRYDSWDDALDISQYFRWCDEWLNELARVLRPGCTCAVLNIPLWAIRHFQHLKDRLSFQNWIVWEGLGLPVRMIMPAHYAILCFAKGEPRPLPG